ncbi:MAG: fibrobacter succinogenes major paralogous domain-containing protein [Fibrobacter sp.]|nr:fibrobacter succinogenes major paralogous domain-containing protein [Fibrobacter sp.]
MFPSNRSFFIDARDGQKYRTVKIGEQEWMAENLNFRTDHSKSFSMDPKNRAGYGRLYTWADAVEACPEGWHMPSEEEYKELLEDVGGVAVAGKVLKSRQGWLEKGNGWNFFSFKALPLGRVDDDGHQEPFGIVANFWTSTAFESAAYNTEYAYRLSLTYRRDNAVIDIVEKNALMSVRCVRDKVPAK